MGCITDDSSKPEGRRLQTAHQALSTAILVVAFAAHRSEMDAILDQLYVQGALFAGFAAGPLQLLQPRWLVSPRLKAAIPLPRPSKWSDTHTHTHTHTHETFRENANGFARLSVHSCSHWTAAAHTWKPWNLRMCLPYPPGQHRWLLTTCALVATLLPAAAALDRHLCRWAGTADFSFIPLGARVPVIDGTPVLRPICESRDESRAVLSCSPVLYLLCDHRDWPDLQPPPPPPPPQLFLPSCSLQVFGSATWEW